jgi:hypothetical protein
MYIEETVPFLTPIQRAKHFAKHGLSFGACDEHEYERMADDFMALPLHPMLHECVNPTGTRDRNRLHEVTLWFGVAYNSGGTGFPDVIRILHIRRMSEIVRHNGAAGFVSYQCRKVYS